MSYYIATKGRCPTERFEKGKGLFQLAARFLASWYNINASARYNSQPPSNHSTNK
jgi:hypothetical protein